MDSFVKYADLDPRQKELVDSPSPQIRMECVWDGLGWDKLVYDKDPLVRRELAACGYALDLLYTDSSNAVRWAVANRVVLDFPAFDVDPRDVYYEWLTFEREGGGPDEWMAAWGITLESYLADHPESRIGSEGAPRDSPSTTAELGAMAQVGNTEVGAQAPAIDDVERS